jgi:hypothetical protein
VLLGEDRAEVTLFAMQQLDTYGSEMVCGMIVFGASMKYMVFLAASLLG